MAILTGLALFASLVSALPGGAVQRRSLSPLQVCQALAKNVSSPNTHIYYAVNQPQFTQLSEHYAYSSSQTPTCVFEPGNEADIGKALVMFGENGTPFAVQSGGHASNPGFSSTTGVHMSMANFNAKQVSADKSTMTVGLGQVWDPVYAVAQQSGVLINGGRVSGVGVGGFLTGGGGYTWFTNQVGLSCDTVTQATVVLTNGTTVTASPQQNSDLFFAIKGGGNRLGVVTTVQMKTLPYAGAIYGGIRVYTDLVINQISQATANFQANNKDPKAQIITTYEGVPVLDGAVLLLLFYDAPQLPSPSPFAEFDAIVPILKTDKSQSYTSFLSGVPANITFDLREYFQTVSLETISMPVLTEIQNQIESLKNQLSTTLNTATFLSWDVEPFLLSTMYNQSPSSAFPHLPSRPFVPLNIYFGWLSPANDQYFLNAISQAAQQITAVAKSSGQNLDGLALYPNYALYTSTGTQLFQQNLGQVQSIRNKYDPHHIMGQCGGFNW